MATAPNKPLRGRRILVCRPQPKADQTCAALREAGADARPLPMIEIQPRELDGRDRSVLQDLDQYQAVIAVSPNAAQLLLEHLDQWWPQWPIGIEWWGPGPGTARVFEQAGLEAQSPSEGHDSEALLNEASFDSATITGKRILLAKGEGGREALIEGLQNRGARIDTLSLYSRRVPEWPTETVESTFRDFNPDTILALSGETLKNLLDLVQNTGAKPAECTLVVPVERVAAQARDAGFSDVRVPTTLSSAGLVQTCAAGTQPSGVTDTRE
ncbi:uroporphyrinogen-III synthase [Halospina denitrificans]|uniref:Uroporphyrinogen-III synthase n=1 Tax=Halospina denitrificans TaxID=332522 RepID=A0A4R7K0L7_9GAMM|nr:uroporphyrinogen-III synthase [Halospina denitrificans]TDT44321.1 uroporphyrinogen-III synthase [Halospina denitrificans]